MANDYPYMISNNKIGIILERLKAAAKPGKFSYQFLKNLGFSSSNDRAIITLLKKLGFLTEDGTPTGYYDRLKDSTNHAYVLGERIRDLYSDLFTLNTNMQNASDEEIKGAFSRITGQDEKAVHRYFSTFKTLCSLANFGQEPIKRINRQDQYIAEKTTNEKPIDSQPSPQIKSQPKSEFHYNIQIHLPATTDISVYNAIFKSLKENLGL